VKTEPHFGVPSHLRQAQCDAVQAEFRAEQQAQPSVRREPEPKKSIRRNPPPLAKALVPTDELLKLRLAEELEYARRLIEVMGDTLSADANLVMRHMVSLQSVDIVGQILGHIATVIRSSDPDGAVERIGMGELKARLQRKGGV
jgi:CHASE3 domain sensor protein